MKFKLFKDGLLALRQNDNWSLYHCFGVEEKAPVLVPVDFAQDVSNLKVYDNIGLAIIRNSVFSLLTGQKILNDASDIKIVQIGNMALVVSENSVGRYVMKVQIWNGQEVLSEYDCSGYSYSKHYLAIKYGNIWSIYQMNGTIIDECAFIADEAEICGNLIIVRKICDQSLYSITDKAFLKQKQLRIVCSKKQNLALCAQIGDKNLSIYNGKWHTLSDVEDFGLIDGIENVFYIKQKGKYILYKEDMTRFMEAMYPEGVDFVACDAGVALIINNGKPAFYKI